MGRSPLQKIMFFVRWQLGLVILSLPAHLMFVYRGLGKSRGSVKERLRIALRCLQIHLGIECGHNPAEALHVVEQILSLDAQPGAVILECGAFLGGSTAKLSHAAAEMGLELVVCDSFEGLPAVDTSDRVLGKPDFVEGTYRGRLDIVTANVKRWGGGAATRYVQGWFDDTLPQLNGTPIACAFFDVDLQSSFRSCLKACWPNVRPGGVIFVHDVDRQPVVDVFRDAQWWRSTLGIDPPPLVGAFTGLDRNSPLLGYVVKS